MNGNIELRMTVEGMRHDIVQHLSQHRVDMSEQIEEAIGEVIGNFDFKAAVKAEAAKVLNKMVSDTVTGVIDSMKYDRNAQRAIGTAIAKHLNEHLEDV